jgi:hypothetical protein
VNPVPFNRLSCCANKGIRGQTQNRSLDRFGRAIGDVHYQIIRGKSSR